MAEPAAKKARTGPPTAGGVRVGRVDSHGAASSGHAIQPNESRRAAAGDEACEALLVSSPQACIQDSKLGGQCSARSFPLTTPMCNCSCHVRGS